MKLTDEIRRRRPAVSSAASTRRTSPGKDSVVTVDEASGLETTVTLAEGMQFDKGYVSPHFVTNQARMEAVLEDAYVLIHEQKLSNATELLPLLEKISQSGRPLLIVAEDVDGDAGHSERMWLYVDSNHRYVRQGRDQTVHDIRLLPAVEDAVFDGGQLQERGLLTRTTTGRRSAFVFRLNDHGFVLRHYWRGGLLGRYVDDTYVWTGWRRTRPVREWEMLTTLTAQGLPVPRPAALRVVRRGMVYRADLITVELESTRTLAERLREMPIGQAAWRSIGTTIRQLHHAGACHADLNAHNILLDDRDKVYVIDWDRGTLRNIATGWQARNMQRLLRSLRKVSLGSTLHYNDRDLQQMWKAYQIGSRRTCSRPTRRRWRRMATRMTAAYAPHRHVGLLPPIAEAAFAIAV